MKINFFRDKKGAAKRCRRCGVWLNARNVRSCDVKARQRVCRACSNVLAAERTRRRREASPRLCLAETLKSARCRAHKNGLAATISMESFPVLPQVCPLLGIKLDYSPGGSPNRPNRPSFDRIDNAKGYVPGNVWIISYRANALKSNATLDELRRLVAALELFS